MKQVSDRFVRASASTHQVLTLVDVVDRHGNVVVEDLSVVSGSVKLSRSAAIYAVGSLVLNDQRIVAALRERLTPWDYELRIRRGVRFRPAIAAKFASVVLVDEAGAVLVDELGEWLGALVFYPAFAADEELVKLGLFNAQSLQIDARAQMGLSLADRSKLVSDGKLPADVVVSTTGTVGEYIMLLCQLALRWRPPSRIQTTPMQATSTVLSAGANPLAKAQELAAAIGMWMRFDGDGNVTLVTEATLAGATPVWRVADGPGGTMRDISLSYPRSEMFTEVTVVGWNPVTGESWTSTRGATVAPRDRRPAPVLRLPYITSQEQCDVAAEAAAAWTVGAPRSLSLSTVAMVALEPGDVISVDRSMLAIDDELHVVDEVEIDLAGDEISVTTRARA